MGSASAKGQCCCDACLSIADDESLQCTGLRAGRQCLEHTLAIQVRPIAEDEMFKVMRSGKRQKKQWKRMLTKVTFVGGAFTRKPPKYERFIRPTGKPATP